MVVKGRENEKSLVVYHKERDRVESIDFLPYLEQKRIKISAYHVDEEVLVPMCVYFYIYSI